MADTIIASISLLVSIGLAVLYVRDRRHAKFNVENEYITSLVNWHEQVIAVLMRARNLKRERKSAEHLADLAWLSALIEQGRFLFPNIDKGDGYGADKPPAYRGYRNLALDFLVAAFNLLSQPDPNDSDLERLQKHFTSVVFEIVRPQQRLTTIRALTDRYFVLEKSFEDFLDHKDGGVIDHIWRRRREQEVP